MLDDNEVRRRLGYHPATPATAPAFELNRALAITVAETWNQTLPPGREAACALTALQEALMWANAAVACNADPEWSLPEVDITEHVDELLERTVGPLHLRSRVVVGGGPVDEGSGGDIGPADGEIGPAGVESAEIDPDRPSTGRDAATLDALEGPVHRRSVLEQSPER